MKTLVSFITSLVLFSTTAFPAALYVPINLSLPTYPGATTSSVTLNENGDVLFNIRMNDASWSKVGIRKSDGTVTIYDPPAGFQHVRALGMNDVGGFVGAVAGAVWADVAFLYRDGYEILGTTGGGRSRAHDVNNSWTVVGANQFGNYEQGFLYKDGTMNRIGTLRGPNDHLGSALYAINDNDIATGKADSRFSWSGNTFRAITFDGTTMAMSQIVGSGVGSSHGRSINNSGNVVGGYGFSGRESFFFSASDGLVSQIEPIPGYTLETRVYNNNDKNQAVGYSSRSQPRPYFKNLFYENGVSYDLDDLLVPGSVRVPALGGSNIAINNSQQILVRDILLNPISQSTYQFIVKSQDPIERIGAWNPATENFDPVLPNSIASGNVYVITHGMAPGQKDAVLGADGLPLAWDTSLFGDYFGNLTDVAKAIAQSDSDAVVLAYSWIDKSATHTALGAKESQAHTIDQGLSMATSILRALDGIAGFSENIHLLGHSHGAKVATGAALTLEQNGIGVSSLSLFDSPEASSTAEGALVYAVGGSNNLGRLLGELERHGIGQASGNTFVESYFSTNLGKKYGVDGMVDVQLFPVHLDGFGPKHGYPVDWYARATSSGVSGVALNLQSDFYLQDWVTGGAYNLSREFDLVAYQAPTPSLYLTSTPAFTSYDSAYHTYGAVIGLPNGIRLIENSPSFWHSSFVYDPKYVSLSFDYEFLNTGDGDQLGIWIGDDLYFLVTGEYAGTGLRSAEIDIFGLEPRLHFLTVALHSTGEANADIYVGNFQFNWFEAGAVIPEPQAPILVMIGLSLLSLRRRR